MDACLVPAPLSPTSRLVQSATAMRSKTQRARVREGAPRMALIQTRWLAALACIGKGSFTPTRAQRLEAYKKLFEGVKLCLHVPARCSTVHEPGQRPASRSKYGKIRCVGTASLSRARLFQAHPLHE